MNGWVLLGGGEKQGGREGGIGMGGGDDIVGGVTRRRGRCMGKGQVGGTSGRAGVCVWVCGCDVMVGGMKEPDPAHRRPPSLCFRLIPR